MPVRRDHLALAALLASAALLVACATPQHPEPEPAPREPTAERPKERPKELKRTPPPVKGSEIGPAGVATPDETQEREGSRDEIAELVAYYRLEDVQVAVVSREAVGASGLGDEMAQSFRESFSELGMRLQNVSGDGGSDAAAIRGIAARFDADLVALVLGRAKERDRFGNFHSFQATVRGTVYEAGGDPVATKEITKVGERSSDAGLAERSALLAASKELGPFLVEQIVRKTAQNVVTRRLTLRGLREHASVERIASHLRAQPGINDVRLQGWNESDGIARWVVYLQPAARANLGAYVCGVTGLDVRIRADEGRDLDATERKANR